MYYDRSTFNRFDQLLLGIKMITSWSYAANLLLKNGKQWLLNCKVGYFSEIFNHEGKITIKPS